MNTLTIILIVIITSAIVGLIFGAIGLPWWVSMIGGFFIGIIGSRVDSQINSRD